MIMIHQFSDSQEVT